jgi:uncharacterized protein
VTSKLKYPGIYLQEAFPGVRPVSGVSTSVTAFIGAAIRGRTYGPVEIKSWSEFEQRFGGLNASSELGYAVQQFFLNGGKQAWVVRGARQLSAEKVIQGIRALDGVEIFNLLVMPGLADMKTLFAAADYCQKRRAFLIVDAPTKAKTPAQVRQWIESEAGIRSPNAAVYYPWIKIADPLNGNTPRLAAPSGTVAGLYSRIDSTRGVWKTPAGVEANLVGVQSLDYVVTDAENGVLNELGVNALRVFAGRAPVVWGGRTLVAADSSGSEWKYISVRRLALFLEESIDRGTRWAVFEPNDEPLWAQIRLSASVFMHDLFRQGAFQGSTPAQAYFVKCDRETTTAADVNLGSVNIVIGFAPLKPAEFVVLKIQQKAGQIAK